MPFRSLLRVAAMVTAAMLAACNHDRSPSAPDIASFIGAPTFLVVDQGAEVNPTISVSQIQCGQTGTVAVALTGVRPPPRDVPLDLILVLDESGSITATSWNQIRSASIALLNRMDAADGAADHHLTNIRIGVIKFAEFVFYDRSLIGDYTAIFGFLQGMAQRGGNTNIFGALDMAKQKLQTESPPTSAKAVVFMTDGEATSGNTDDNAQLAAATGIKNLPARLFVIGVGNAVNTDLLSHMASPSSFASITDFAALGSAFDDVANQVRVFPAARNLIFSANIPTPFTLVAGSSSADRGQVNVIGSAVNWAVGELGDETVTLRLQIEHDRAAAPAGGMLTALNAVRLQATRPIANTAFTAQLDNVLAEVIPCNRPPVAHAGGPYTGTEGSPVALALSGTDPDGDALSFTWNLGDGTTGSGTPPTSHVYADNDTYTISLTVDDGHGGTHTDNATATIANAAPILSAIRVSSDVASVNTSIGINATYTDAGTADTHTGTIDWGDGSTSAASVGAGSASASHTYTRAGLYTIALAITDDDGGSGRTLYEYVAIYDPAAGYLSGVGSITSPAGAYAANPSLTGTATFGLAAEYLNGWSQPTGSNAFQLQLAGLSFRSAGLHQWLVVAGPVAYLKGSGTLNGQGDYGFLVAALDGQRAGGGGIDKLRFRIWNKQTGAVVYDNGLGGPADAPPTTPLRSGAITISQR